MEKFLYPNYTIRCIITSFSECGKSVFLTNLTLNNNNEYNKIYIHSPSLHQEFYQELIKYFNNYVPINIIPNILNEEDIDIVIDEIVNNKDFQNSDCEIDTYDNIKELKYPSHYENNSIVTLDDLDEKEINNDKTQAKIKRGHHNILFIFTISQD